jgi:hypothetical protein
VTAKRRTIGSLTHADFGQCIRVAGGIEGHGVLWSAQHAAAVGDIPEPWTRLIFKGIGGNAGTRGLPPATSAAPEFRHLAGEFSAFRAVRRHMDQMEGKR